MINTTSYQHYLPDDDPTKMTPEAVTLFLDSILEGDAPVYGGFSYTVRLYRAYYEAKTNIFEMWKGKLKFLYIHIFFLVFLWNFCT